MNVNDNAPKTINACLGEVVESWKRTNPEALRRLKRFNDEHDNFFFMSPEAKAEYTRTRKAAQMLAELEKGKTLAEINGIAPRKPASFEGKKPSYTEGIGKYLGTCGKLKAYQKQWKEFGDEQ